MLLRKTSGLERPSACPAPPPPSPSPGCVAAHLRCCEQAAQRVSHTSALFTVLNGPQRPGVCLGGPELPSGPHWGRERAFHRAGRGLTPFISYFPQLKIGSKLLWPRGRGGGRRQPPRGPPTTRRPHLGPAALAHCGWAGRGVACGWEHVSRHVSHSGWPGAGAGAGHEPQPTAPSKAWGWGRCLGAALTSGQSPGLPLPTARRSGRTWGKPSPVSGGHGQGPSGRGAALFLHPLGPWLGTSLMLAPNGQDVGERTQATKSPTHTQCTSREPVSRPGTHLALPSPPQAPLWVQKCLP